MKLMQAKAPAAPANPELAQDAVSVQLAALTTAEVRTVNELVDLQGQRVSLQSRVASASGGELTRLRSVLQEVNAEIDGHNAKLADIRVRIKELQTNSAPAIIEVPAPPVFPGFAEEKTFGMNHTEVTVALTFSILFPLVLAVSRWIWRRSGRPAPQQAAIPDERMARIEQAVEAVAIEVERIGESQRFQTKLMSDKNAERVPVEPR